MFNFFKKKASKENMGILPFSVDIHAHILPGIDDGSKDEETTVDLVRRLHALGIKKIIATPHITEEAFPNNRETIQNAWKKCMNELQREQVDMDISYSAEYRLDGLFDEMYEAKQLIPFPDNYLLIENSFLQPYWRLSELLFDLQSDGYSPILAHPERYGYYYKEKKILENYKTRGCLFQCNILSFTGYYGKSTKEFAMWLLNERMIDFIATDVHNARQLIILEEFLNSKAYSSLYPIIEKNEIKNNQFL